jgi:glycosyltransferase involved in cell wall biosynthesis
VYLEKKYNIDIVQTNDILVSFCAILARKFTKVPVVLRVGGEYFNEIGQWSEEQSSELRLNNKIFSKVIFLTLKKIGNYSMKNANQLISVNKYMQDYLRKFGFESEIINNAVDITDFIIKETSSEIDSILTISNMAIPKKVEGIKLLIDAIYILKKEIPQIQLKIAGNGPFISYLENHVNELSLNQNVTFLGYVDNIPCLLEKCNIYVHSSMQDVFPNSILEAMASKKPVIAINVGGISEIITNRYNGILCEPNAEKIATSFLELRNNELFRRELAERGFLTVMNEFSWDRIIDRYLEVYKNII